MQQRAGTLERDRPANQTDTTKMISVRFPLDLLRDLQALARKNDRSVTAEMVRAVRAHLAHNQ